MRRVDLVAGFALLVGVFALPVGCGGGTSTGNLSVCPGPDCACSGQACTCSADKGCSYDCTADNCGFTCGTNGTCEGSCAKDCDASCPDGSDCTLDLGQSGDAKCVNATCDITAQDETDVSCDGGTCTITCLARCDISCVNGAVCEAKCPGDSEFKPVEGSLQCQ